MFLALLVGCPESTVQQPNRPDAQLKDAGIPDNGFLPLLDSGIHVVDTGVTEDAGADSGVVDTGAIDTGVPYDAGQSACPDGDEGCLCGLGGSCNDPGLECLDSSGGLVPPQDRLFLCVRRCQNDGECVNSPVGNNICRPVFGDQLGCVSGQVTEGQIADISRLRQVPMTGCPPGTIGLPQFLGLDIERDQVSCGRPCSPTAVSGPLACGAQFPYCTNPVLNNPMAPGICTARRAGPGDLCSRRAITNICDTSVPNNVCIGVPYSILDPNDPTMIKDPGICMQLCDLTNPDCAASDDPGAGAAACRQIRALDNMVGVCSNECTRFPSRCTRPGAFGEGSTCTGELAFEMGLDITICMSVVSPTIPDWTWFSPPMERCRTSTGAELRCEAGSFCADDMMGGVCVRGCSTASTATGCEGSVNPTCNSAVFDPPTDDIGACYP